MTQKCGGAILSEAQIHYAVMQGLALEEKKEKRR